MGWWGNNKPEGNQAGKQAEKTVFFLFGFGQHLKELGRGEYRTCPRCNNHTQWQRMEISQRFTLFFIPIISWGKKRMQQCTICGESLPDEL